MTNKGIKQLKSLMEKIQGLQDKRNALHNQAAVVYNKAVNEMWRDFGDYPDQNLDYQELVERHDSWIKATNDTRSEAPKLNREYAKFVEKINSLDEEIKGAKSALKDCHHPLFHERRKELHEAYLTGRAVIAKVIRPFCEDDEGANDLAGIFPALTALHSRMMTLCLGAGIQEGAHQLIRDFEIPIEPVAELKVGGPLTRR